MPNDRASWWWIAGAVSLASVAYLHAAQATHPVHRHDPLRDYQLASLSLAVDIVDVQHRPLDESVPVHLEVFAPFDRRVAAVDSVGTAHVFERLPRHGNAFALLVTAVRTDTGDSAQRIVTSEIRDGRQHVTLMLLPENPVLEASRWEQVQQSHRRLADVLSAGKPTPGPTDADPYDRLMAAAAYRHFRLLSFLAVLETFPLSGVPAIDRVKALDWETAFSAPELSLWVDPELVTSLTPRFEPAPPGRRRMTFDTWTPPKLPGSAIRWWKTDAGGKWDNFPPLDASDQRAMQALRKKYGVPERSASGAPNVYYAQWGFTNIRQEVDPNGDPVDAALDLLVEINDRGFSGADPYRTGKFEVFFDFLVSMDRRRSIGGVECVLLTLTDRPFAPQLWHPSMSSLSMFVSLWYGAQNDVPWRYDPAFGVTRPSR